MAHDEETERDTPAQGHLIDGTELDGGLADELAEEATDARPIASPFQIAPPAADVDSIAVASSPIDDEPAPEPIPATGRSKALIAAAIVGVLVVGGAVAATIGGSSPKSPTKSAAPTAGLAGEQVTGDYVSGATSGSPWVWQTGQSKAKSPGATSGSSSQAPGAPTPSGTSTGPGGTPLPSAPSSGAQHTTSAPGHAPSGSVQPPSSSSAGGPTGAPPSATPPSVSLVTGPGCQPLAGAGGYASVGSGTDSGWGGSSSGGWGSDGCSGAMQSMPMTGDATNGPNRAMWSFGSGTAGFASCVVSVYVPWDGKATDTGGTAAEYQVSDGTADTVIASYTVDQNTTHGQWTTLGTVNIGGNTVRLRLLDHGIDYPAGWRYGVSAAKLQCTG